MICDTVAAELPTDLHQATADVASLFVGILSFSMSSSTLNERKQDRNFILSPRRITFERHGNSSLIAFSIAIGAIFSPPAVIISSFIRPTDMEYAKLLLPISWNRHKFRKDKKGA